MRVLIVSCLLIIFCTLAYAQNNQDTSRVFTQTQLVEDLVFLKTSLENQHPGLYWYYSKAEFEQDFDSIVSSINQPMNEFDFYRMVSAFNAGIGCGHTNILHEDTYFKRYPNRLPFDIVFIDEKAMVSSNFSDNESIARGDEILSINGIKTLDIKEDMMKHMTSDGFNQTHKLNKINGAFSEQYATLIAHPNQYEIEYRKKNTEDIQRVILMPIHHDDIEKLRAKINKTPTISFENNVALWNIKSFLAEDIKKCGKSFKKYYKYVFKELKKRQIEHLIIDLRGNHGGIHTACVELFRYLTNEVFQPMEFVEKVSKNGTDRTKNISKPNYALREKSPLHPHFSGNLIILADGGSYSATTEFIALARLHQRGVVVGEETGGGFHGCTAGKIYTDQLPNTGIKVFVPTLRFINSTHDNEPKGHGIYPDYEVPLTYGDWILDHDAVMQFALDLTEK